MPTHSKRATMIMTADGLLTLITQEMAGVQGQTPKHAAKAAASALQKPHAYKMEQHASGMTTNCCAKMKVEGEALEQRSALMALTMIMTTLLTAQIPAVQQSHFAEALVA